MEVAKGPACNREEILTRLMAQYQVSLLHMCCTYLRDGALAEDAVQETFLKAYKALPAFRGECSEKTWLMRIAVNTCRDLKRSAWFRHVDRRMDAAEAADAQPENAHAQALAEAIALLPRRQKEMVLLYYYQDMTLKETAEALGTSIPSVSRQLKQACARLRAMLKEELHER